MSYPVIHPLNVEGVALEVLEGQPQVQPVGVRMDDVPGKPATLLGLILRFTQFVSSAIALTFMVSTTDFTSVEAFCFLVAAAGLNCIWSLPLALADLYALALGRRLRDHRLERLFTIGDGIVGLLLFIAASSSGGMSNRFSSELHLCVIKHCGTFKASTVFAFISFFALSPSFFLNLSSWAS